MKDFPFFTTENGVAGLVFKEIPYRGEAYITIHNSDEPEKLLADCLEFCKAAGAEKVYACGCDILEEYPLYTHIYEMSIPADSIGDTEASLFPVTKQTLDYFRSIYNEKMGNVPAASYMTFSDADQLLNERKAYFVHRNRELLGIAIGSGEKLDAVASVYPVRENRLFGQSVTQ